MLVDAAKQGDVEIPVFCYEPKLGEPVGACRMCLVEIEGMPKLQTACSTPVRDGMVVYTQTDRVKEAQNAVVEFLLVNHPLDCPVCDKGGECPLQDIAMGWGPGKSRLTDPKRHFQKPIELSPLVAIDRERCILCYRCVRFSQEVAEDEQLQLLERGDRTFVGTFDERPYIAPFHGNIIELCPVGALTSYTYRFRARPWDIEQAGSVCTLCPSQCNVSFTVRDERVLRVIARDNAEVDDGWLCDKGRFGFQMFDPTERITRPMVRAGDGSLEPDRLGRGGRQGRRRRCGTAARRRAAIVGGASNEEGWLVQRIMREALGSPHIDSRPSRRTRPRGARASSPGPRLGARVARPRQRRRDPRRRHRPPARDADPRPADPQGGPPQRRQAGGGLRAADRPRRRRRGGRPATRQARPAAFLAALAGGLGAEATTTTAVRTTPTRSPRRCATPRPVSIIWGERHRARARRRDRGPARPGAALDMPSTDGSGLLEVPEVATPAACARSAACPTPARAWAREPIEPGHGLMAATEEIRSGLRAGRARAIVLFGVDPVRDFPDTEAWRKALAAADFVVAFSTFETATTAMADIVFPLETHAEKDGTVTHPDGRLQRVRPSARAPAASIPAGGFLAALSLSSGPRHRRRRPSRRLRTPSPQRSPSTLGSPTRRSAARHALAGDRQLAQTCLSRLRRPRSASSKHSSEAPAERFEDPAPRRPSPRHLPRPLGRGRHRAETRPCAS